ncbi:uncharacterized protein LOC122568009 [Bombus pyrosoma]|uniref:uncharacterized protein LOC122568009 n=1 Tax=Bombus pyrosoma TaxID=396416 RepID=UPI001CB9AAF4|nr:uncharacterized protein LOC122568009 [Bombus pyrosoma]
MDNAPASSSSKSPSSDSPNVAEPTAIKLPEIQLSTFDGAIENWHSFYDAFSSMIDRSDRLTATQKFYYLRSSLTGKAARSIRSLKVTEINYPIAIDILKKKFDCHRQICMRHWDLISEYPKINKKTPEAIDDFLETVKTTKKTSEKHNRQQQHAPRSITFATTHRPTACPSCKGQHKICYCNVFKATSVKNRLEIVKRASLCTNCLGQGHTIAQCSVGSCRICRQRHHTYLHQHQRHGKSRSSSDRSSSDRSSSGRSSSDRSSSGRSSPSSPTPRSSHRSRRASTSPRSSSKSSTPVVSPGRHPERHQNTNLAQHVHIQPDQSHRLERKEVTISDDFNWDRITEDRITDLGSL